MPILASRDHPMRGRAEHCIREVYARAFGARIDSFPDLLALDGEDQAMPRCAAGLRFGTFFSECYLDEPIEAVLGRLSGRPVRRAAIVEVTTLAGTRAGHCLPLIAQIVDYSRGRNAEWAFFTLTARLRHALRRWGLPLIELAPALAARVPDPANWGRYYEADPWVCAIHDSMIPQTLPNRAQPKCRTAPGMAS